MKDNKKIKISDFKKQVKEGILASLSEKKKKKDEEIPEEEVETEETEDIDLPPIEGEPTGDNNTDPKSLAIQTALKTAYDGAKELGDEKLTTQIGNTITYFTRAHVVKGEPNVAENLKNTIKEIIKNQKIKK